MSAHHPSRAWAVRDERYCHAHRDDEQLVEEQVNERLTAFLAQVRAQNADANTLLDPAIQRMIDCLGSKQSLQIERGALRLALYRLAATSLLENDLKETVPLLTRLVDAIGRTVRVQQAIEGNSPTQLDEAIDTVFGEQELDGPV